MAQASRMHSSASQTQRSYQTQIVWWYILSGTISGISLAIGDVESFGGMWLPGFVFGLLFAVAHRWRIHAAASFASLSAITHFLAVQIALQIFGTIYGNRTDDITVPLFISGLTAGAFGALILVVLARVFADIPFSWGTGISTMLLGGAIGAVFMLIAFSDRPTISMLNESIVVTLGSLQLKIGLAIRYSIAFVVWQSIIGTHISYNIVRGSSEPQQGTSFSERLAAFLQGPLVQLIGLVGTLIGLLSYFFPELLESLFSR